MIGTMKLEMNESDIKKCIKDAVEASTGMRVGAVTLTYHQGYSDPREHQAASVSATVTLSK